MNKLMTARAARSSLPGRTDLIDAVLKTVEGGSFEGHMLDDVREHCSDFIERCFLGHAGGVAHRREDTAQ